MSNQKSSGNMNGKGYYIALILCAVAIGIAGYLYYQNANDPNPSLQKDPSPTGGDIQAVATQPTAGGDATGSSTTPPATTPRKSIKTVSPVSGKTVAEYAMDCLSYNETTRDWRVHNGIDIAAETGTQVSAAADGTVYTVFEDDTMGTTVVIRHDEGYVTQYASLDKNVSVKAGDTVTAGQKIGTVGQTALLETAVGEHVHFSVTCDGKSVDPAEFLPRS